MAAFNSPDHLDPREKGLRRDPELSRELLHFSTVILLLQAWCKTCSPISCGSQCLLLCRETSRPHQSRPRPGRGNPQQSNAEPNGNLLSPSASELCGWYMINSTLSPTSSLPPTKHSSRLFYPFLQY